MTTRSENYIQLFEGFKLGSLGISKKPKVTLQPEPTPEPIPELKILKEEETSVKIDGVSKRLPSIYWADVDGYRYHLQLDYRPEHKNFLFVLMCGKGIRTGGMMTLWQAYGYFKSNLDHDELLKQFDFFASGIRSNGIKSIAPSEFKVQPGYTRAYQRWLKERKYGKV